MSWLAVPVFDLDLIGPATQFWRRMPLARYMWALPNSLIGLAFLPATFLAGGSAEFVDGVLELQAPMIRWLLQHGIPIRGGAAAITFGHVVLGRDREVLSQTRAHERVHVRQYEQWGPVFIPAYLIAGLYALITGAGAYHGNVFERAAFKHEQALRPIR